ncbi:hypothetical protein [uncultured Devosia sp.]|uniref:hypothetical protein n=1 Tax=uncultured Devosia sp. TaxID=211434 RepID=UPI0026298E82|nr:hypothetical protein [uncultured Devosia sp.]
MTVYNASKMAAGIQPRVSPTGLIGVLSSLALAAALVANDTINMLQLEAAPSNPNGNGPTIMNMLFDSDQLDSNGAPTITFDLGDATTAARYMSQVTNAKAGGIVSPNVAGAIGYQPFAAAFDAYPTDSQQLYTLVLKCHTAAATWQNGSVRVMCEYTYDP